MRRSISNDNVSKILTENETKIFNVYKEEFNDCFYDILNIGSYKFITNVFKRVKLGSSHKLNDFSSQEISKVETYISETYYPSQYKLAYSISKQLIMMYNSTDKIIEKNALCFNGQNFLKHCKNTDVAVHTCGEKLLLSNLNYTEHTKNLMLYCQKCNQIYNKDLIRLSCSHCDNVDYLSKLLITKEEKEGKLQMATWSKYHCGAVINDTMKCLKCKETFYFDVTMKNKQILMCLNCGFRAEANQIMWKCIFCKKEFESEVKVYNHFEFKSMKIAVKDALIKKVRAHPDENLFKCGCNLDFEKVKFKHKKSCNGEMYLGTLDKKKILVCSLCHSLNFYDSFSWTCPLCEKKFSLNDNFLSPVKNDKNNNNEKTEGGQVIHHRKNSSNEMNNMRGSGIIRYNSQQKLNENVEKNPRKPSQENKQDHDRKHSPFRNCFLPPPSGKKNFNGLNIKCPISSNKKINEKFLFNNNINYTEVDNSNKENISANKCPIDNSNNKPKKNHKLNNNEDLKKKLVEKFNDIVVKEEKEKRNYWIENFNAEDYEIKKKIGEGSFGKIYFVTLNQKKYAMKKLISTTEDELRELKHEIEMLKDISINKNIDIINVYGVQTKQLDRTTYVMYILMELAVSDWEKEILRRTRLKKFYTEKELINLLKSLLKVFSELQAENVSHRDIKPQNILICPNNVFKVADFGEAKELKKNIPDTARQTIRGTELFMSPILFKACSNPRAVTTKHNTYKSDVWSLALCFLFASTLSYEPLEEIRHIESDEMIEKLLHKYLSKKYSEKFINILQNMLKFNEKERLDFIEAERDVNVEFL